MSVPTGTRLVLPAADPWIEVPPDAAGRQSMRAALAEQLAPPQRAALAQELDRALIAIDADPRPSRQYAIWVTRSGPAVIAVLTLDLYAAKPGDRQRYLDGIAERLDSSPTRFTGRVLEAELAGAPAVVLHDFVTRAGAQLCERYLATLFVDEFGLMVQLEITTPDLDLFADIVDAGNTLANRLRWVDGDPA